jgi:hypothetical protein
MTSKPREAENLRTIKLWQIYVMLAEQIIIRIISCVQIVVFI